MSKTLWQKIKQNHLLMMVLCCLIPVVLAIGLFSFFKGSFLIWAMLLLCPLMHFLMMKEHGHKKDLYKCPECGFEYKEKKWAEKCEAWCRKNKSCNLAITQHAVKK